MFKDEESTGHSSKALAAGRMAKFSHEPPPLGGCLSCDQAPEGREEPESQGGTTEKKRGAGSRKAIKKEQLGHRTQNRQKQLSANTLQFPRDSQANSSTESNLLKFTNSVI